MTSKWIRKRVSRTPLLSLSFFIVLIGIHPLTLADYTWDCIESEDVFVNDETDIFFSKYVLDILKKEVDATEGVAWVDEAPGIQPIDEPDNSCEGNDFVGPFIGTPSELTGDCLCLEGSCERVAWHSSDQPASEPKEEIVETKGFVVRTKFKGGLKDLRFVDHAATVKEANSNITMDIRLLGAQPQMLVRGDTCQFISADDITMLPSYPQSTEGSEQNYKNLGTFAVHQLVKVANTEGCNLASDAKETIVQITAGGRKQALPSGFELRSREARADEDERYERTTYPGENLELVGEGKAKISIFNRPTELLYRVEHPYERGTWVEIDISEIDSDHICSVFGLDTIEKKPLVPQVINIERAKLEVAKLSLRIDTGSSYFQNNPRMGFKARWFAPGGEAIPVSESDEVKLDSTAGDTSEIELLGNPSRILPGRYRVEIEFQKNVEIPSTRSYSFFWNSGAGHNVADSFGVLGPLQLERLYSSPVRSSARIMRAYYLHQPITGRFVEWENWPKENSKRFAEGILWHFRSMKSLPYLSQWQGPDGTAAELVRALSVVVADDNWDLTENAETAFEFLSKLDRMPENFSKSIFLRRAMCQLSSTLRARGEPIPTFWMECE